MTGIETMKFACVPIVCTLAIVAALFVSGWIGSPQSGIPRTWVYESPIVCEANDLGAVLVDGQWIPTPFEEYTGVPSSFINTEDSVTRIVTDRITGDQVLVVNDGWYEGNRIKYRILRIARIDFKEYSGSEWALDKKRFAECWIAEERWLEELRPIPSA